MITHLEKISSENAKVLIFVATKRVADDITKYLRQDGWPALAIHGDKEQYVLTISLFIHYLLNDLADASVTGFSVNSRLVVHLF